MVLDSRVPSGPIEQAWEKARFEMKLVNPANKRKFNVIVVGSGLAGGSAAASLGELGYNVKCFCFQDSPRRAHSIAAQGGINAAKNYQNDGDSVYRLFYDTVKGGDFRAREHNVYRLAQISVNIIDQCVAQGVPFAREYGGLLANRSFGGAQVSRTFYARGQTGQQLLLGAYQALEAQVDAGRVTMFPRTEMLDLVVVDGKARGIITRDLVTGKIESHVADAVILATGGYGNVFYLSTNAKGSNCTAIWRAYKRGAAFANPCFTQIHPTCIPVSGDYQSKLTLMCGIAAQRRPHLGSERGGRQARRRVRFRKASAIIIWSAAIRASAIWCRAMWLRAPPKRSATKAAAWAKPGSACISISPKPSSAWAGSTIEERYGNLFEMYERITGENPYETPMRIYPAIHYTMGGLWVDYQLMSTIPGLFVLGEANFSDHGANRLGASALMQGLSDGYFVIPYTLGNYLASTKLDKGGCRRSRSSARRPAKWKSASSGCLSIKGKRTVASFHRELGKIVWDYCGMSRNGRRADDCDRRDPRAARGVLDAIVNVPGSGEDLNQQLEGAGRVADFFELGELMCLDALRAQRELRRPFPRGISDRRRRGAARRRALSVRGRVGVQGAGCARPSCTRSRSNSSTCIRRRRSYK